MLPDYLDLPPVLTVLQTAEVLECHPDTVRQAIHDGRLTVVHLGRALRIPRHRLVEFLEIEDDPAVTTGSPNQATAKAAQRGSR